VVRAGRHANESRDVSPAHPLGDPLAEFRHHYALAPDCCTIAHLRSVAQLGEISMKTLFLISAAALIAGSPAAGKGMKWMDAAGAGLPAGAKMAVV